MSASLSVAIIGGGAIAGGYDLDRGAAETGVYTHAGAYRAHGGYTLRTIVDVSVDRARSFREAWAIERAADSLEAVLADRHDVVSVCTPDETHASIVKALLHARCCRTIFAEKPLALGSDEILEIIELAERNAINVVCNFQRRFEPAHNEIRNRIANDPGALLSVTGHYIKGLRHIGSTLLDTLTFLAGRPLSVQAFRRVRNQQTIDFSYEFVLFYPSFTAAIKTVDAERYVYNYHVFELDMLFANGRIALVDNSQGLRESVVTGYAYSGVNILNDKTSTYRDTAYNKSMTIAASYIHDVTTGSLPHTVNTPHSSYDTAVLIERIEASYEAGAIRTDLEAQTWKR